MKPHVRGGCSVSCVFWHRAAAGVLRKDSAGYSTPCQLAAPRHKLTYFISLYCVATPGGAVSQLTRNFYLFFLSVKWKKVKDVVQILSEKWYRVIFGPLSGSLLVVFLYIFEVA